MASSAPCIGTAGGAFLFNKEGYSLNYNSALIQLPLVREATGERVRTPEDVRRVCQDMAHCAQESFHTLLLDSKNRLINRVMVSLGLADASLVHPREVFRTAIEHNASAVVLTHNHPHILKHSLGSHMANAGMPVQVIQHRLGHRNISSTMVYVQMSNIYVDRAFQAVLDSGGIV